MGKILVDQRAFCFLSVPLNLVLGNRDPVKDRLHDQLRVMPAITPALASLIPYGDCNCLRGRIGSKYKEVHCDFGYDKPVQDFEGKRILKYAFTYELLLYNMCLKKHNSYLITDRSGNTACVLAL